METLLRIIFQALLENVVYYSGVLLVRLATFGKITVKPSKYFGDIGYSRWNSQVPPTRGTVALPAVAGFIVGLLFWGLAMAFAVSTLR